MRTFAGLDDNNIVTRVLVAKDEAWLVENLGGVWVESFRHGSRKQRAGIGFTYDEARDAFIPPQPFASWVLDEDTCLWVAPVPYPEDGGAYVWDEDAGDWVAVNE